MFYVKTKINDETTIRTELTDENIFTTCPGCGKEQKIHLNDIIFIKGELYASTVYCDKCYAEIKNNAKK